MINGRAQTALEIDPPAVLRNRSYLLKLRLQIAHMQATGKPDSFRRRWASPEWRQDAVATRPIDQDGVPGKLGMRERKICRQMLRNQMGYLVVQIGQLADPNVSIHLDPGKKPGQ